MNRLQPCAACGCPVVFHRASTDPSAPRGTMVCEECTRRDGGRERRCPDPTA